MIRQLVPYEVVQIPVEKTVATTVQCPVKIQQEILKYFGKSHVAALTVKNNYATKSPFVTNCEEIDSPRRKASMIFM